VATVSAAHHLLMQGSG